MSDEPATHLLSPQQWQVMLDTIAQIEARKTALRMTPLLNEHEVRATMQNALQRRHEAHAKAMREHYEQASRVELRMLNWWLVRERAISHLIAGR